MKEIKISDITGFKIGHAQNLKAGTGCTVIIADEGAVAGVDVRGGAPSTRETDLLDPKNLVEKIHAVVLSGGSAFGLDASSGVMKYLEVKEIGFDVQVTKVPIVCEASLFDLTFGDHTIRPDQQMGYEASINSEKAQDQQGNVGAGCGATIGKILGPKNAMKGGLGTFAVQIDQLKIGAVVAVNCLGDIINKEGKIIAGALDDSHTNFIDTSSVMIENIEQKKNLFSGNTTIGTIITNAKLTKSNANKIASVAHNGYARSVRPVHSMFDGDTIFVMSTDEVDADLSTVGMLASDVMSEAVVSAVKNADSLHGVVSYEEFNNMN